MGEFYNTSVQISVPAGRCMNILHSIGKRTIKQWRSLSSVTAVICGVLLISIKPRYWPRTVRELIVKQVLFTAIDALGMIILIAVLSGISIVTQAQVWLAKLGQSTMLGAILVAVIIREIGPLLVNLVIIGRSGTAVATELAGMKVRNEIDVLDSQGIDPMIYLVMPRVIGMAVSVLCLTVIFSLVSLLSGYLFGMMLGVTKGEYQQFINSVTSAISPKDVANFLAKTIIPGLTTGAICCMEGIGVQGSVTEIPQAATRGVVRSIAAVLVVSAIVSILTYT